MARSRCRVFLLIRVAHSQVFQPSHLHHSAQKSFSPVFHWRAPSDNGTPEDHRPYRTGVCQCNTFGVKS